MRPGPLASRNFRLLLACDVISAGGTAVATVALPFAVLRIGGSATDVGYVAAAYLVPLIGFLLLGGVVADRLPRHQVMVAANALQALAQAASAVLLLAGHAQAWELAGLAADAVSFAVAGALRAGMRFPALPPVPRTGLVHELREGWRDFVSRRWLWVIVAQFAFVVAILAGTQSVLGPLVADAHLGGARSWGLILAAEGAGAVLGGFVMIRFRPRAMLLVASLAVPADSVFFLALAVPLAVPAIAATAFAAGASVEVFSVNWATTMQQEIPPASRQPGSPARGGPATLT